MDVIGCKPFSMSYTVVVNEFYTLVKVIIVNVRAVVDTLSSTVSQQLRFFDCRHTC